MSESSEYFQRLLGSQASAGSIDVTIKWPCFFLSDESSVVPDATEIVDKHAQRQYVQQRSL